MSLWHIILFNLYFLIHHGINKFNNIIRKIRKVVYIIVFLFGPKIVINIFSHIVILLIIVIILIGL